jgi:glyoxylase-like metal-dependent hydrolase (beta-lactamase superfamily II)
MDALAALGYKPEQVTKILLTHKHADHSGELRSFPNAKIYVNAEEIGADELKDIPNIVPVEFTDGAYHNFPESQKIADGVYFIKAKGHTNGNSLIIAENEGLFYMFEGDITYVDEALYANKLSVVFDDLPAARETMDRVREFVRHQPTVYCGTHTPQGYENLEAKRVMDLDNPVPTVLAEIDFSKKEDSGKYVFGLKDTMEAIENGMVDILIIWENIDFVRLTMKDNKGETRVETVSIKKVSGQKFKPEGSDTEYEIIENISLSEWLLNNYKKYVTHLEIVTDKTSEGNQFVKGFGGIGGILRYKLEQNFETFEENHSFDEEDFI